MKIESLNIDRPALFEKSDGNIWTDPYIQQQMLAAHLDPDSDAASRRRESIAKIADFVISRSKPAGRLLDLGCGPGLYTSIFQERGFRVTGVDFNKVSIEYALSRASDLTYIDGDYIENYPGGRFDTAVMIYCDFGTHSDDDRDRLLGNIHDSLEPGGVFIFDIFNEALTADKHEGRSWDYAPAGGFWDAGEYLLLSETFHYPQSHAFAYRHNLITEAGQKDFIVWERYYSEEEITAVLRGAGFRKVTIHRNLLSDNNFTSNSEMFVVAEK
jgi:SAM-dependent methyltransferase